MFRLTQLSRSYRHRVSTLSLSTTIAYLIPIRSGFSCSQRRNGKISDFSKSQKEGVNGTTPTQGYPLFFSFFISLNLLLRRCREFIGRQMEVFFQRLLPLRSRCESSPLQQDEKTLPLRRKARQILKVRRLIKRTFFETRVVQK